MNKEIGMRSGQEIKLFMTGTGVGKSIFQESQWGWTEANIQSKNIAADLKTQLGVEE